MLTQVWSRLGLAASAVEYSQPVNMGDGNALSLTITVFSGALASAGIDVLESNDLENWKAKSLALFGTQGVGSNMVVSGVGSITSAYVRFKVTNGSGSASVIALTVNTSHQ